MFLLILLTLFLYACQKDIIIVIILIISVKWVFRRKRNCLFLSICWDAMIFIYTENPRLLFPPPRYKTGQVITKGGGAEDEWEILWRDIQINSLISLSDHLCFLPLFLICGRDSDLTPFIQEAGSTLDLEIILPPQCILWQILHL